MARSRADELTVAEAKAALRRRSRPLAGPASASGDEAGRAAGAWLRRAVGGRGALAAGAGLLVSVARRRPVPAAAAVVAAGIAVAVSRPLRRAAIGAVRKALGPGG